MSRALASVLTLVLCASLHAAIADAAERATPLEPGQPLPRLAGRMLTGQEGVLPEAARGRVALVMLGFSYASRHPVEEWATRFRARFGADSALTLFEVPMIGGMARMAAPFIESGMRKGTPRELHDHVIVVYGDTRPWRVRAGWDPKARDDAYLVLLDADGVVRWTAHARWDEALFGRLAAEVERLRTPERGPEAPPR